MSYLTCDSVVSAYFLNISRKDLFASLVTCSRFHSPCAKDILSIQIALYAHLPGREVTHTVGSHAANTELANAERLLPGEIQGWVPVSLSSHFTSQATYNFFLWVSV